LNVSRQDSLQAAKQSIHGGGRCTKSVSIAPQVNTGLHTIMTWRDTRRPALGRQSCPCVFFNVDVGKRLSRAVPHDEARRRLFEPAAVFSLRLLPVSSGRRVSIMAFAPSFLAANVAHRTDNVTIELDKLR
jgi:hypothetical protein